MYYFRRGIPVALRAVIGQREFSTSLGVKDTFAYGLNEMVIATNPMAAVAKVRPDSVVKVRDKDFTTQERITILSATLRAQPANLAVEHAFARRWVPWLCGRREVIQP